MTQIMLPAVFSRKDFDNILRSMSDEDAAAFAATNRTTFASCFSLSAPGGGTADVRPAASPGPVKAREPKASPAIDKTALAVKEATGPCHGEGKPFLLDARGVGRCPDCGEGFLPSLQRNRETPPHEIKAPPEKQ